jgi:hypothetical protein
MAQLRETTLSVGRDSSMLTIPRLLPPEGWVGRKLPNPYQGVGARGVNNIASKLLLALFPPNAAFLRVEPDEYGVLAAEALAGGAAREIKESLVKYGKAVTAAFEASGMRPKLFYAMKQLVVAGNVLLYLNSKDKMRVFPIDRYVITRDSETGQVLRIIIKEKVLIQALPVEMRAAVLTKMGSTSTNEVEIYTGVEWKEEGKVYDVWQEVADFRVQTNDKKPGKYKLEDLPFFAIRWGESTESYGTGHVEEFLGDLQSLEGLSQAIVEGSAALARMLWLVNPNGITRMEDVAYAPNGAVRPGIKEDIGLMQAEKTHDFRVAAETAKGIETRMSFAFLLNTAVQRDAERVTAEEIRIMIQELEDALGGVYSILSEEMQRPLLTFILNRLRKDKKVPDLPDRTFSLRMITGLEALGRGHEFQRLNTVLAAVGASMPEAKTYINQRELLSRFLTVGGVDPTGLVYSEEDIQAQKQQAMLQQGMLDSAPEITKQVGNALASRQPQQPEA